MRNAIREVPNIVFLKNCICLFVCFYVEVLGLSQPNGVMSSAVSLLSRPLSG